MEDNNRRLKIGKKFEKDTLECLAKKKQRHVTAKELYKVKRNESKLRF